MKKLFILASLFAATSLGAWAQNADDYQYPYSAAQERDPLNPWVNDKGELLLKEEVAVNTNTNNTAEPTVNLQGIMFSNGGSTVIINNEIYREGDYVGKSRIKKIEQNGVVIEGNGKEYFLKWGGS